MKKVIVKIVTLLAVFFAAYFLFSRYLNQDIGSTSENMDLATLPLVYMVNEGTQINCLHGYKKEMDVTSMRDTLTPLTTDQTLEIQIQPYQNQIDDISFEVLSSDGSRSLENTKVTKITENGNYISATLEMQQKMLINTEYVLKIRVTAGDTSCYYYTRVIYQDNLHTKAYLDFVLGFYEKCISGMNLDTLAAYIEPDETGNNTTLAHVNIHCTMDQISWADLNPQVSYKPTPSIKEINENTATIRMDYMVSAQSDSGRTEYYQVSEYYRLRYTEERIMLLDFERDTSQMFDPEGEILTGKGINLGINGWDIEYKNDLKNRYFAFALQGTLWLFDTSNSRITEVFSFPQEIESGPRDTYNQNDIQIINIDENGNMYFLVCGYMNRGAHEGESGVAVYYYNSAASNVEECLFVDTRQCYELLKQDVNALAYVTTDRNRFYICVDDSIYGIQLDTRQVSTIAENIRSDCFVSSESGRYFAWLQENQPFRSTKITVIDFDTLETREISCADTERIRPLGFMDEDLVYGIADAADVNTEHEGNELFPMKKLFIVNGQGETVKTYEASGYYVTGIRIEDKLLTLERVTRQGLLFTEASEDHIVSNSADEESAYGLTTQTTSRKQTEMILRVGKTLKAGKAPQITGSRQVVYEGSRVIVLEPKETVQNLYYVYAKGKLNSACTAINTAVNQANELLGVVVNSDWQNIWERGNKATEKRLNLDEIPDIVRKGSLDVKEWENALDNEVLDLSGCPLDAVLYYVSEGTPVAARTPVTEEFPQGVVIIVGYDPYNTILLQPGGEETFYYGMDDSTELFEEAGNIFLTYWDPISE
ncbi:MAG: hypothetical protein SOZ59_06685 [Candidatus Limivivens sp.]|nr:hypothetical protein [Candidatus Limivivens sp.]